MRTACAASTSPVPFGTETTRSSIVTETSSGVEAAVLIAPDPPCNTVSLGASRRHRSLVGVAGVLIDGREDACDGRVVERALAAEVCLEVASVLAQVAGARIPGEVAERAERLAEHAVADARGEVEVSRLPLACLDLGQELDEPARPFSTRRALPAGLVHVE